jgi:hypothetical protein
LDDAVQATLGGGAGIGTANAGIRHRSDGVPRAKQNAPENP